jgi:hypothetical protein
MPDPPESRGAKELIWSLPDGRSLIAFAVSLGPHSPAGRDARGWMEGRNRVTRAARRGRRMEKPRARARTGKAEETTPWIADF